MSISRTFKDQEGRFTVSIGSTQMARLLSLCLKAGYYETGGILIGHYSQGMDTAVVAIIVSAPEDSHRGRTWFSRGLLGLQALIFRVWSQQREYYLGEWHYHPNASPEASAIDVHQMQGIASSESYKCPEPILLIIGGDPAGSWAVQVMVFEKNGRSVKLD